MNNIFDRDTIKLLRIPFSYFLLPVFLFAISRVEHIDIWRLLAVFISLHLFIYPASNGYNSYIDKDETPIGGLEHPPKPSKNLFWATVVFDIIGLAIAVFVNMYFFVLLLCYMLASRAYSSPSIRLKSKPLIGFFTVIVFQGAVTFAFVYAGVSTTGIIGLTEHWAALLASSLLIAGVYPLTQIYQHDADRKDGVTTISMLLGYRGTFIFSLVMFAIAGAVIYMEFFNFSDNRLFIVFLICLLPVILFFNRWMMLVWKNTEHANFKNTMTMNAIAATCMNIAFIVMIIMKQVL